MNIYWCHEAGEESGLFAAAGTANEAKLLYACEIDCPYIEVRVRQARKNARVKQAGILQLGDPALKENKLKYREVRDG